MSSLSLLLYSVGLVPGDGVSQDQANTCHSDSNPIIRPCDAPTNSESRTFGDIDLLSVFVYTCRRLIDLDLSRLIAGTLGIMEDWMLKKDELKLRGRRVTIMRDVNVAMFYFHR